MLRKVIDEDRGRIIVVTRNPADVVLSLKNFIPLIFGVQVSLDELFELYKDKKLVFGDWCDFTNAW